MAVREPPLVADPRVVNVGVLPGEHADDLTATDVDPDAAARAAVLADRVAGGQVERPSNEPVRRRGERPHRADLDRVAAEGRREILCRRDRDPLARAPTRETHDPVHATRTAS